MTARFTLSVPEAGQLLGLGRGASYAAARRGEIPTLPLSGGSRRVPIPKLLELVGGTAGLDPNALRALGIRPADDQAGDASGSDSPPREPDPNDTLAKGSHPHGRTAPRPDASTRHLTGL